MTPTASERQFPAPSGGVDSTLSHALSAAAARGVHVRMIVSDWTLGGANETALHELAARGGPLHGII